MDNDFRLTPPVYEPWLLEGVHLLDIFRVLCELVLKRGYIVLGSKPEERKFQPCLSTNRLFQRDMPADFFVYMRTDVWDWNVQSDIINEMRPDWPVIPVGDRTRGEFYRLIPLPLQRMPGYILENETNIQ